MPACYLVAFFILHRVFLFPAESPTNWRRTPVLCLLVTCLHFLFSARFARARRGLSGYKPFLAVTLHDDALRGLQAPQYYAAASGPLAHVLQLAHLSRRRREDSVLTCLGIHDEMPACYLVTFFILRQVCPVTQKLSSCTHSHTYHIFSFAYVHTYTMGYS